MLLCMCVFASTHLTPHDLFYIFRTSGTNYIMSFIVLEYARVMVSRYGSIYFIN